MHRAATIDFQASLAAQRTRCREILERVAEQNRSAELLRRLCPWTRTHRPGAPGYWTVDERGGLTIGGDV